MVESIDAKTLHEAVKALLQTLPVDLRVDAGTLSAPKRNRLRNDIADVLARLSPLSRSLDPVGQPPFVFNPTNPEMVGELIGRMMMEQQRFKLETVPKVYGSGVYAIFYRGDFDAYTPIRDTDTPIYVGKADPPTPDCKTVEEQGPKLSIRLTEHGKSVRATPATLRIDDFDCRFLVVQSGWQRSAEDYLLNKLHPIWNTRNCYGFGKHGDSHKTRANARSPWDTLHPGRPWATHKGNVKNALAISEIKTLIAAHFDKYPPKKKPTL